jgi:hypothetical protein
LLLKHCWHSAFLNTSYKISYIEAYLGSKYYHQFIQFLDDDYIISE